MPSVQCFCPIHYALVDSIYENKTEYHRLGGFNKESLFLIGWKSKIKEVAQSGCGGIQAPSFATWL